MRTLLFLIFSLWAFSLLGQPAQEPQADFTTNWNAPNVVFDPILPPLAQIAGAPTASYDYYWEFGDGTFSFEKNPKHIYADTTGHEVYFMATGKYDNGKAPKSRKKKIETPKGNPKTLVADASLSPKVLPDPSAPIGLRAVRNPLAGEEMVCILAYANHTPTVQSGKLYLFYNQKAFKNEHFNYLESRTHYGEKEETESFTWSGAAHSINGWTGIGNELDWYSVSLPNKDPAEALNELKSTYNNSKAWIFNGLQPEEQRNLFISLNATDQMVADTNAIITMTALMISDDQRVVEEYALEMEIVASHDPNYIAVSQRRMGFRRIRSKDLIYKVHFQNNGEGPANTIQITCDVPHGLNATGLQVLDLYPKCLLCPEQPVNWSCLDTSFQEGKVIFTFKNIYLPGTRQEGISDRDSTKGFVKYRLVPDRKIRKLSLDAHASIVFDKNPPIQTNRTATHFKPGISPGLMAGWNIFPSDNERNYFSFGLSLAPFKPYRRYLQWEIWTGFPGEQVLGERVTRDTVRRVQDFQGLPFVAVIDSITTVSSQTTENPLYFNMVPLQLRKNVTDWLGIGAGLMLNVEYRKIQEKETIMRERKVYDRASQREITDYYLQYPSESSSNNSQKTTLNTAFFADLHLGMVRQGPSVGLRGILQLEKMPTWYVSLFATWKL